MRREHAQPGGALVGEHCAYLPPRRRQRPGSRSARRRTRRRRRLRRTARWSAGRRWPCVRPCARRREATEPRRRHALLHDAAPALPTVRGRDSELAGLGMYLDRARSGVGAGGAFRRGPRDGHSPGPARSGRAQDAQRSRSGRARSGSSIGPRSLSNPVNSSKRCTDLGPRTTTRLHRPRHARL